MCVGAVQSRVRRLKRLRWGLRVDERTITSSQVTYRKLAEAEWAHVPPVLPGRDDPERYGKRFRITHIMETLAQESGDIEALVAIKRRDLSQAYAYLEIAEIYKVSGLMDGLGRGDELHEDA